MSISQASVFICDNDDPNSVRGDRPMCERGFNKLPFPIYVFNEG